MLKRFSAPVSALLAVMVLGTIGYRFIEGWTWLESFWMMSITLTTIGFGEVRPLTEPGRWFTLGIIWSGVGVAAYTASVTTAWIVDGGLQMELRERKRRKWMEGLNQHYVVIGLGRLGREVAEDLRHAGKEVVIIDPSPTTPELWHDRDHVIVGDGAADDCLKLAAVERAAGVAVATGDDATNVYITLSIRQMNPTVPILTRVDHLEASKKATKAGATRVVSPFGIGGTLIARALLHPAATSFLSLAVGRGTDEMSMEDVRVGPSPHWHRPLRTLDLRHRYHLLAVAVDRQSLGREMPPDPDRALAQDDVVVVVGRPSDIERLAADMGHPR